MTKTKSHKINFVTQKVSGSPLCVARAEFSVTRFFEIPGAARSAIVRYLRWDKGEGQSYSYRFYDQLSH